MEKQFLLKLESVADVFDALTSERPYKKAWSIDDAISLIQKEKEQHFDSRLVDLFIDRLPVILEIKEKFLD